MQVIQSKFLVNLNFVKQIYKLIQGCGAEYDELFTPTVYEKADYKPFVFGHDKMGKTFHAVQHERNVCYLKFDWKNGDHHFDILLDKELFKRMSDRCDVIQIVSNKYFSELLVSKKFGGNRDLLTRAFKSPYKNMADLLLKPQYRVLVKYDKVRNFFKNKRYLSIHSRGFYDDGTGTAKAFECANKLLRDRKIDYVFFATESTRLEEAAKKVVMNSSALYMIPKKTVPDSEKVRIDSFSIRENLSDLDIALVEWYIIGEATFCMSPTIGESTFSKTAIARGDCKYIPVVLGNECEDSTVVFDKESYVTMHQDLHIDLNPELSQKEREKIWKTVIIEKELVFEQCVQHKDKNFISNYWGFSQ